MTSSIKLRGAVALSVALLVALAITPTTAWAQDASAALRLRSLAAMCANCHGSGGQAVPDATVPGLAGQPADYIAQQMKAFSDGTRPSTVMQQIARGYTDAQVAQLAAWFAAQPQAQR